MRLGCGTALEARWHHRSSTDLDFFFSPGGAPSNALFHKDSSDPDWHEDKALPIWWGDLWVNDGGRVVPRHD